RIGGDHQISRGSGAERNAEYFMGPGAKLFKAGKGARFVNRSGNRSIAQVQVRIVGAELQRPGDRRQSTIPTQIEVSRKDTLRRFPKVFGEYVQREILPGLQAL